MAITKNIVDMMNGSIEVNTLSQVLKSSSTTNARQFLNSGIFLGISGPECKRNGSDTITSN